MHTKIIISKAIYSVLFSAAMLFAASSAFAQVKIGTNPTAIDPNSNLEVEGSISGRKMTVDKATGKVTIADASQGAGRVFTSDANGVGTWIAPASQDSPVLFSIKKSVAQSVPLNSVLIADFNTENFDKGMNFNLGYDLFTVPANGAGYYQINGDIHTIPLSTVQGAYMRVFVNGVDKRVVCVGNATVGAGVAAGGAVVLKLNANDQVDFRFDSTVAGVVVYEANVDAFLISR